MSLEVVSSLVEGVPPAEVKMFYSVKCLGGVLICSCICPHEAGNNSPFFFPSAKSVVGMNPQLKETYVINV